MAVTRDELPADEQAAAVPPQSPSERAAALVTYEAAAEALSDAQLAQRLDVLAHRVQEFPRMERDAFLGEAARRLRKGRHIEGPDAPRATL